MYSAVPYKPGSPGRRTSAASKVLAGDSTVSGGARATAKRARSTKAKPDFTCSASRRTSLGAVTSKCRCNVAVCSGLW